MKHIKRLLSVLMIITMLAGLFNGQIRAVSATPGASLSDISNHWASEVIEKYIEKEYVEGYPDGTFRPNEAITRAEFVKLANKVFLIPDSDDENIFTDVASTDWFYTDVIKASTDGYIRGYADNTFMPNNLITRQEACVVLYRLLVMPPIWDDSKIREFSDVSSIATWSKNSVASMIVEGILNGYADKTIRPNASLTRAEALCLMDRALEATTPVIDYPDEIHIVSGFPYNSDVFKPQVSSKAKGKLSYIWELSEESCNSEIINGNTNETLEITGRTVEGEFQLFLYVTNIYGISTSKTINVVTSYPIFGGMPDLPEDEIDETPYVDPANEEHLLVPDGNGGYSIEKENDGIRFVQKGERGISYSRIKLERAGMVAVGGSFYSPFAHLSSFVTPFDIDVSMAFDTDKLIYTGLTEEDLWMYFVNYYTYEFWPAESVSVDSATMTGSFTGLPIDGIEYIDYLFVIGLKDIANDGGLMDHDIVFSFDMSEKMRNYDPGLTYQWQQSFIDLFEELSPNTKVGVYRNNDKLDDLTSDREVSLYTITYNCRGYAGSNNFIDQLSSAAAIFDGSLNDMNAIIGFTTNFDLSDKDAMLEAIKAVNYNNIAVYMIVFDKDYQHREEYNSISSVIEGMIIQCSNINDIKLAFADIYRAFANQNQILSSAGTNGTANTRTSVNHTGYSYSRQMFPQSDNIFLAQSAMVTQIQAALIIRSLM